MTKSQHTPGPWKAHMNFIMCNAPMKSSYFIAQVNPDPTMSNEEALANARLIAAAPELLEALEQVDGYFTACGKHTEHYSGHVVTHPLVKAAIAKAKGQTV